MTAGFMFLLFSSLIDHHPQLYKKPDQIAIRGWLNIYYDIYKQYFGK